MNDLIDPIKLAKVRAMTESGVARELRVGKRLSLSDIAVPVGASVSTIFRWERGQRVPHGERAVRYLEILEGLIGG
jgi:DNA-binding transcriptional regulator YiaG